MDSENWVYYECVSCGAQNQNKPDLNLKCTHLKDKGKPKIYSFFPQGFVFEEAPERVREIVTSPDYFNKIFEESGKRIKGEEAGRKALILLLFGGRLVENAKPTSFNCLLSALSGAGKDYLASNILALLPKHYWDHKTRLSEKALSYWHDSDKEPNYSWNGRVLYCEDASNNFLNCDTTKIMMSGGSNISIVKDGEILDKKINGSPVFILTSATAEPSKELIRRVSIVPLDIRSTQTEKILDYQSKVALDGLPEYDQDLIKSAYLLRSLSSVIPFSKNLVENFPKNLVARTIYDGLLDLIKASAVLHQYSRRIDADGSVIAQKEDLELALDVFKILHPYRTSSLTHAQKAVLDYLKSVKKERSASELFREVGHNYYTQIGTLINGLRSLANKGFVDISEGERNGKPCDVYSCVSEESSLSDLTDIISISDVSEVHDS